ncbi:MAG: protein-L-isoaspartate(D-aspartate) O-methyltransferase, partial [Bacteroidales bacterium]|nr:protein-L-isoaspartate(D-aspartate) O-methyltransferase [Bacteroidales bacterium]
YYLYNKLRFRHSYEMNRIFSYIILLIVMFSIFSCNAQYDNYEEERYQMVSEQIEKRGVRNETVLEAMRQVERHLFVPENARHMAYEDHPLPIGDDQTISQPYIVALMSELLDPDKSKKILEVGTGSGYQAAVLAEICDSIYTIEIFETLGLNAQHLLNKLGYANVKVIIGDGYQGWAEAAPYDGIIVTCAPTHIPESLKEQLAEGGKMIIPVGESYAQELVVLQKIKGKIRKLDVIPVRFVPMINKKGETY